MESPWTFSAFLAPDGAGPGTGPAGSAAPSAADSPRLRAIRRLRGRILFDGGRRPAFREPDDQVQDLGAWHFTARRGLDGMHGPPLGYVRLLTPATAARYQSREYLGDRHYGEVLATAGLTEETVFEHSRLVVEHRARKLGLGLHLNALAVAAAHELGAAAMIGTSGTADGQDRFHARFGFHPVPGTRRYVEKYTEDVVILLHRTADGAGEHTALVDGYRLLFRELMADAPAAATAGATNGGAADGTTRPACGSEIGLGTGLGTGLVNGLGDRTPFAAPHAAPTLRGLSTGKSRSTGDNLSTGHNVCAHSLSFTRDHNGSRLWDAAEAARAVAAVAPGPRTRAASPTPAARQNADQNADQAPDQNPNTVTVPHRRTPAAAPPRRLTAIGPSDPHRWKPVLFRPVRHDDRMALAALLNTGAVREVADTIEGQLEEVIRSREPGRVFDADELAEARRDQLAGVQPWDYGSWAWYPWSGRLVHVLPCEEYRLVRTDRNRGKIARPEQRRLLTRRVGVIGLSVGNSAAVTLAQEGVAGAFKLADFDSLSVSNLNRLRAGLHQVGVNKAVLAARQMYEIDPYLDIEVFPAGLTEENMREFFLGGHGPIDLLVEECDTPWVKLAAREAARDLGVPVVMDCNDRGLLDVERFDHEPHRPLLHGRLGPLTAEDCHGLSPAERIQMVLDMVDADRVSPELAASFPEIGRTLSSWPQLASGVALGGALVTEAARRILLGGPCGSGRFYVDLDLLIAPDRDCAADLGQAGAASLPSAP